MFDKITRIDPLTAGNLTVGAPGNTVTVQAVPTAVAEGPDGWIYAGQLTGAPFPQGAANVYRVASEGGTPEVYASGFTNIIDIAFGPDGNIYVTTVTVSAGASAATAANTIAPAPAAASRMRRVARNKPYTAATTSATDTASNPVMTSPLTSCVTCGWRDIKRSALAFFGNSDRMSMTRSPFSNSRARSTVATWS